MLQFQVNFWRKLCLQIFIFSLLTSSSKPLAFFSHAVNFWFLIFLNSRNFGNGTDFCFDASKEGHFLDSDVLKYVHAESGVDCILQCFLRDQSCRSINFRKYPATLQYQNCELLYDVDWETPELLRENDIYEYYMLLQPNRTKIVSKSSCKELLDDDPSIKSGIYYLKPNNSRQRYPVYCHMTEIPGCGLGGWTLVMKTNGSMQTFRYESPLWTNTESYAVDNGLAGLQKEESKLASYWITSFTRLCLGMYDGYGDIKWLTVNKTASSLFDVIYDGKYRQTTVGRDAWKSIITNSSLQPFCNKEGFGVISYGSIKMRLGYMCNNEPICTLSDSCIGFGISYTSCFIESSVTCGNIAQCSFTDNGDKQTAAFGYILVQ